MLHVHNTLRPASPPLAPTSRCATARALAPSAPSRVLSWHEEAPSVQRGRVLARQRTAVAKGYEWLSKRQCGCGIPWLVSCTRARLIRSKVFQRQVGWRVASHFRAKGYRVPVHWRKTFGMASRRARTWPLFNSRLADGQRGPKLAP